MDDVGWGYRDNCGVVECGGRNTGSDWTTSCTIEGGECVVLRIPIP